MRDLRSLDPDSFGPKVSLNKIRSVSPDDFEVNPQIDEADEKKEEKNQLSQENARFYRLMKRNEVG